MTAGLLRSNVAAGWTAIFLATTVLTSVTGFLFPADKVLPSHIVGSISLVVLAAAIVALYAYRLARSGRWIYVASALFALYLNVFVLVAQAFLKVPFLKALAPTQSDPPFIVAQVVVMVVFILLGVKALKAFHPDAVRETLHAA